MNKKLLLLVNLTNLFFVLILLFKIKSINSDKVITLLYFYYPLLLGANLLLGVIFYFANSKKGKVFFMSFGILLLAIVPIIIIVSVLD